MEQLKEKIEDSVTDDSYYNVIMFNDDYTPFDYVIMVLNQVFGYKPDEGLGLAMHIHMNGKAIVASTSMEEAYKKMEEVDEMNKKFDQLLQTNVEKA